MPASPSTSVRVDWSSGKGTSDRPAPDPSPRGWYQAAFGGLPADQGKVLYLTLDDGPGPATPEALKLLRKYGAKATFFVVGNQAANQPGVVSRIRREGHALGNHTWSHPDLVGMPAADVASQLSKTRRVANTGQCMRPPYGSIDKLSGKVAESMGMQPVMWTAQAFDWKQTATVQQIVDDLKRQTSPGSVVLLHDGGGDRSKTVAALQELLPYWTAAGYRLEVVPACES